MMKYLLSFLLFFSLTSIYAQQRSYLHHPNFQKANSTWSISRAFIDFNGATPVVTVNDSSQVYEGCASVSDTATGAMLFYSNGSVCRDKNNNIMPNGDSLFGNGGYSRGGGSTTQGVCIVPMVDSPGKYYLFSLYGATDNGSSPYKGGSLFYSVVNMHLRAGLGDIEQGRKNVLLNTDTMAEGMVAIPGNNCDLWLVVHQAFKPLFVAYHITASGLNTTPVVSRTGESIQEYTAMGSMSASPRGDKIAVASFPAFCYFGYNDSASGVLVCKFDGTTGIVSDAVEIKKDVQTYTVAFSPNANYLYISDFDFLTNQQFLKQYDISSHDASKINASEYTVAEIGTPIVYMKLYKDKIYFQNASDATGDAVCSSIESPDSSGIACSYKNVAIELPKNVGGGGNCLPNDVVYPWIQDTVMRMAMDTFICKIDNGLTLQPVENLGSYQYTWNNGEPGQEQKVQKEGKYWVTYGDGCHFKIDTFVLRISDLPQPIINVNVFHLSTVQTYTTFQWLFEDDIIPGATDRSYHVTQNGRYRVIAGDGRCTDTSDIYTVTNYTAIESTTDVADLLSIYPNPATHSIFVDAPLPVQLNLYSIDGRLIKKTALTRTIDISELSEGVYFLHVFDRDGTRLKVVQCIKLKTP